ncbi:recombinase family protein [Actinomadura sp. LD22]|uniref:Recombinase family protein n=1 Tax=Actinomadura physcomitrii TaxID=2650748 RepID=A0A6I4MRK1_9ACTN|nr:recombinase family protein [Actinomadura physcomitrii]MWA07405.1 recombinase family protein [Actinomadura physcomitrii]
MGAGQTGPVPLDVLGSGSRTTRRRRLTGPGVGRSSSLGPLRLAFAGRTSTEDQQDPTLSIPRQLNSCRTVLPDQAVIVAHFYDIESGRKALALRGRGRGHEQFSIPVPRDGGIQDLLEEASRPDRRFDAVICESIDRISRRTYIGTLIENTLEEAGVLLLAADEPIVLNGKRASQVLTRRVKQGVAEWYVLELLEKSWGGFEAHTDQGYNVGKPPYGFTAEKIPHPVPAKRAEGASKHTLVPDPAQGPVVVRIYELRIGERLGYAAIADRLNRDLGAHPPPVPVDPTRAVGRWTASSVRDVLVNPKNTGYMVWNRRASKTDGGRHNPPESWVWSSRPTHKPLVSIDTFVAAQQVAGARERSRSRPGKNIAHPATQRSYRLRSYIKCAICGRRMFGKTRKEHAYMACQPPTGYKQEGHPKSVWVREDRLLRGINDFFAANVFGAGRKARLETRLLKAQEQSVQEWQDRTEALRREIDGIEARRTRLLRRLEHLEDDDEDLFSSIRERSATLSAERNAKLAELARVEQQRPPRLCAELLEALPEGEVDLAEVPEPVLWRLFEAFRLEIRYDKRTDTADCRITLTGAAIDMLGAAAAEALPEGTMRPPATTPHSYLSSAPGRIRTCDTRFRRVISAVRPRSAAAGFVASTQVRGHFSCGLVWCREVHGAAGCAITVPSRHASRGPPIRVRRALERARRPNMRRPRTRRVERRPGP